MANSTIKISLIFLLLLFFSLGYSQKLHELKYDYNNSNHDSLKASISNDIAFKYVFNNIDSAKFYNSLCVKHAKKTNSERYIAKYHNVEGFIYLIQTDNENALKKFQVALDITRENNFFVLQATVLNNIAVTYTRIGKYQKSIDSYLKSLELKEKLKISTVSTYNNLSSIYYRLNENNTAIKYSLIALTKIDSSQNEKNDLQRARCYLSLGAIYWEENKIDSSFLYLKKAIKSFRKYNKHYNLSKSYYNLAHAFKKSKNFDSALYYQKKAKDINEDMNYKDLQSDTYSSLASIYYYKENYIKAIENAKEGVRIYDSLGYTKSKLHDVFLLAESYSEIENYKQASYYFKKYIKLNDSILSSEIKKSIRELEIKYETLKKENENRILKEKNLEKSGTIKSIVIIALFLILTLGVIVILIENRRRILKKKATQKIHENKNVLNSKWIKIEQLNLQSTVDMDQIKTITQEIFDLFDLCYPNFASSLRKRFSHWSLPEKQLKLAKIYSLNWSDSETIVATGITASISSLKHLKKKVKDNLMVKTDDEMFRVLKEHLK